MKIEELKAKITKDYHFLVGEISINELQEYKFESFDKLYDGFKKQYIEILNITDASILPNSKKLFEQIIAHSFDTHKKLLKHIFDKQLFSIVPTSNGLSTDQSNNLEKQFTIFSEKIFLESLSISKKEILDEIIRVSLANVQLFKPYYELISTVLKNNMLIKAHGLNGNSLISIAATYLVSKKCVNLINHDSTKKVVANISKELNSGEVLSNEENVIENSEKGIIACDILLRKYLYFSTKESFNKTGKLLLKNKKSIRKLIIPKTPVQSSKASSLNVPDDKRITPDNVVNVNQDSIDRLIAKINSYGIQNIGLINNNIHNLPAINFKDETFKVSKFEYNTNNYALIINYDGHPVIKSWFSKPSLIKGINNYYLKYLSGNHATKVSSKDFLDARSNKKLSKGTILLTDEKIIIDDFNTKTNMVHFKDIPKDIYFDLSNSKIGDFHHLISAVKHYHSMDEQLKQHWLDKEFGVNKMKGFLTGSKTFKKHSSEKTLENVELFFENSSELKHFIVFHKYGRVITPETDVNLKRVA